MQTKKETRLQKLGTGKCERQISDMQKTKSATKSGTSKYRNILTYKQAQTLIKQAKQDQRDDEGSQGQNLKKSQS